MPTQTAYCQCRAKQKFTAGSWPLLERAIDAWRSQHQGEGHGPIPHSMAFVTCRLCHQRIAPDEIENPGGDGLVSEINPLTSRRASMHQICLQWAIDDLTPEQRDHYNDLISR